MRLGGGEREGLRAARALREPDIWGRGGGSPRRTPGELGRFVRVTLFVPPETTAPERQTSGKGDADTRVDLEELIDCAARQVAPHVGSGLAEQVEGNCEIVNELVAASTQKGQLRRKRLSELGITQADDNLMSQEMFVSIVGNQFRWNGKGSFGTFLF